MRKSVTNVAASVRQRLLDLARDRNEDFGLLLTKYALERLLFRIGQSEHRMTFILKGALLFELWTAQAHRPTRDADFLSIGSGDPRRFEAIFKEICVLPVVDDGLAFDPSSLTARQIKEGADYEGGAGQLPWLSGEGQNSHAARHRIWGRRNPSGGRDGVPDDLGWAGSRPSHLSEGDSCSREVRGDGEARHRKHPDERLPRPVLPIPSLLIRGTDPLRSDRADIRASQDQTPAGTTNRFHGGVF